MSSVKKDSTLVTHFYFEAILLHGDPSIENSLRVENETSLLYPYAVKRNDVDASMTSCMLSLSSPPAGRP